MNVAMRFWRKLVRIMVGGPFFESYDLRTARKALANASEGESELDGKRILKDSKMVVIGPTAKDVKNGNGITDTWAWPFGQKDGAYFHIIAFPRAEHIEDFKRASLGVQTLSPADYNPGGIVTYTVKLRKGEKILRTHGAQFHYRKRSANNPDSDNLSSELAKEYAGARKRCLRFAIMTARDSGMALEVKPYGLQKDFMNEAEKVRNEMGARKEVHDYGMVIRP